MKYKILNTIGSKFTKEAREILKELGALDCLDLSQKELAEKITNYDVLLVGLGLNIDKNIINKAKNLKAIATATTGLDHIDTEAAQEKNITILSLKNETEFLDSITGTAELAFGLIIDLMRLTPWAFESVKNYEWQRENFRGHNLFGQTLGIVGLGRLGKMMARYANAFGMNVLAYDPRINDNIFAKNNCEKTSFEKLIQTSDIISLHVHLSPETENMFNLSAFKQIKKTAFLINTSRGKLINENDLLKALEKKQIAGYATDVLADELNFNKSFQNHPLVEYAKNNNNLIIVPHIGGMTHESRENTDLFMAKKIQKYLS